VLTVASLMMASCVSDGTGPGGDPRFDPDSLRARFSLEPLGPTPFPANNPRSDARIALGQLLFFDPILSGEQDVSCSTCHHPEFHFADGRALSAGVSGTGIGPARTLGTSAVSGSPIPLVPRNAPTVLNAGMTGNGSPTPSATAPLFWDGRAAGLEGQVLFPIAAREEMRGDAYPSAVAVDSVVARLRAIPGYRQRFLVAFPAEAAADTTGTFAFIDASTMARAVAAYERELVTRNTPFDRFVAGDDEALTLAQRRGLSLFFSRARCFICHRGPMLSNFLFLVTGTPQTGPGKSVIPGDDTGREEHTGDPADRYRFRVPGLRNVELTAPYMHDGSFQTLEDVVRFYNDGAKPRHPAVSDDRLEVVLREPLGLTDQEVADLVAFMGALTDPGTDLDPALLQIPVSVPSGLPPVGN